jgi:hypothetical protein
VCEQDRPLGGAGYRAVRDHTRLPLTVCGIRRSGAARTWSASARYPRGLIVLAVPRDKICTYFADVTRLPFPILMLASTHADMCANGRIVHVMIES